MDETIPGVGEARALWGACLRYHGCNVNGIAFDALERIESE